VRYLSSGRESYLCHRSVENWCRFDGPTHSPGLGSRSEKHGPATWAAGVSDGTGLTCARTGGPIKQNRSFSVVPLRMGLEGIVSKRLDAPYRSGPSKTGQSKNLLSEAVRQEREEDWGKGGPPKT
jgi:hypothetical protein